MEGIELMKLIFKILTTLLLLSLIWLCFSCGTRQVETVKRDSISINNSYLEGEKIVLGNSFTYKPFDALKPMQIDGKTYQNVIISNDKTIVKEKWKNRYITKTITVEKTKKSEKSDYSIMWIGIAAVVVFGVVAYLKIPSIKV
jgi:hypothetical protein